MLKTGFVNVASPAPPVQRGGTLKISELVSTLTFDPATPQTGGAWVWGTVFDVLMTYDPVAAQYQPKMAESLTSSADQATWTLKLRPGVKFTDGTPVDAAAVVYNMERGAKGAAPTQALIGLITEYQTPDDLTVVFRLSRPWATFPYLLATPAGMLISPTAAKADEASIVKSPVGAGAFKLKSFVPGEKIELVRNDSYWGGDVSLDGLTISSVRGAQASVDRLKTNEVQMAFILDTQVTDAAIKAGIPGFINMQSAHGFLLNARDGKPTADVRVRQAVAAALDLKALNQRVDNGVGAWGSSLMWEGSRWHVDTPGPQFDPDKARKLVEEVKATTGWDGKLKYIDHAQNDPALGQTVQALLNNVGFDVTLDIVPTINDLSRKVVVESDFEMSMWALTVPDSAPWASLFIKAYSTSPRNTAGLKSPELDKLIDELGKASTDSDTRAVLSKIQAVFTEQIPFVVTSADPYTTLWTKDVHGVVPSVQGSVLLDQAYLAK